MHDRFHAPQRAIGQGLELLAHRAGIRSTSSLADDGVSACSSSARRRAISDARSSGASARIPDATMRRRASKSGWARSHSDQCRRLESARAGDRSVGSNPTSYRAANEPTLQPSAELQKARRAIQAPCNPRRGSRWLLRPVRSLAISAGMGRDSCRRDFVLGGAAICRRPGHGCRRSP